MSSSNGLSRELYKASGELAGPEIGVEALTNVVFVVEYMDEGSPFTTCS